MEGRRAGADRVVHRRIQRLGSAAAETLRSFAEAPAAMLGLTRVSIEPLGDESWALAGRADDANEATVCGRMRSAVMRVTAASPAGDPLPDALAVAAAILAE